MFPGSDVTLDDQLRRRQVLQQMNQAAPVSADLLSSPQQQFGAAPTGNAQQQAMNAAPSRNPSVSQLLTMGAGGGGAPTEALADRLPGVSQVAQGKNLLANKMAQGVQGLMNKISPPQQPQMTPGGPNQTPLPVGTQRPVMMQGGQPYQGPQVSLDPTTGQVMVNQTPQFTPIQGRYQPNF
jgi:hypothetical protein